MMSQARTLPYVKKFRFHPYLLLVCFYFAPLCVAETLPPKVEAIFKTSRESLDKLKDSVKVVTLDNGMQILFYRRGIAPVFAAVMSVGVGGVNETRGETGIAHMFEHMAFKGTTTLGTRDYEKEKPLLEELEKFAQRDPNFSSLAAFEQKRLGEISNELAQLWDKEAYAREYEKRGAVGLNAQTDKDHTTYMTSLPKSSFEYWAKTESERLLEPILRQFYQERNVVLEERRMRFDNEPASLLYESLLQKAFTVHPYGLPLIGFRKDIDNLTATKLDRFRRKYYSPKNIVISLVGDVDPEKDLAVLKKYFSRLANTDEITAPIPVEPAQKAEVRLTEYAEASPQLIIAYHKPNYPHSDDAAISLVSEILTGSSQSPLFNSLVKKEQLASAVAAEEGPGTSYPNLLIFSLIPRAPHSNKELLTRFDQLMVGECNNPSEAILTQAKRSIAVSYLSQMKSNMSLANTLASVQLRYRRWEAMIDWYEEVLQVTRADITRVCLQYLTQQNRVIGFLESSKRKRQ